MALDVFVIESLVGDVLDPEAFISDLRQAVDGHLNLSERLAARSVAYARRRRPGTAYPFPPEVLIYDDASAASTVIEVKGQDEMGLLHRLTQALFESNCDVVAARVATLGGDIVDSFYVQGPDGRKLNDPGQLDGLRSRLQAALNGV
jgi:[protein-PII] uridylyltransferase